MPSKEIYTRPTDLFGENLSRILADKIKKEDKSFKDRAFVDSIKKNCTTKSLTQRIELLADKLKEFLPDDYLISLPILVKIMGEENEHETGMFKEFYWLMPVGKYIEKYGLDYPDESLDSIGELTKRNTGEYAVRPFIRMYPAKTLNKLEDWSKSDNFHLRRLSSEGLRPKLPWASKLDLFIDNPKPVFRILNILRKDNVKFVKKSIANNITDYIKVNPEAAYDLIDKWKKTRNEHTLWIINYATRKSPNFTSLK